MKNGFKVKIDTRRPALLENLVEVGQKNQAVDKTQRTDSARRFDVGGIVYYLKFKDHTDYYKNGSWKAGADGKPVFCVSRLTDEPIWA